MRIGSVSMPFCCNSFAVSSTESTREAIADAVFHMSSTKVGALITIEQHNSLDQYAERAIQLNSDISKELLEQIFIKDSPLHDGGVIIRGNKIVCAGAYYVLTQDDRLDKTVGSLIEAKSLSLFFFCQFRIFIPPCFRGKSE